MVLKITLAAAVLTALLGSFLLVRTSDEGVIHGAKAVITVWDMGEGLSRDELWETIADTAADQDLGLYRVVDAASPAGQAIRTLFIIRADPTGDLPQPSVPYPSFGRSVQTTFGAAAGGSSPVGSYVTSQDMPAAEAFVATLAGHGVSATARNVSPVALVLFAAELAPLFPLVFAAGLVLALGCTHAAVRSRRQDAIREVNGATRIQITRLHVTRSTALTALLGVAGVTLSIPVLALYNGLAQFPRFACIASLAFAGIIVTTAAVATVISATAYGKHQLAAISGRRPVRRLGAFCRTAHLLALALVLVTVAYATAHGLPALQNKTDTAVWADAAEFTSLTFRLSNSELDRDTAAFADIGRHVVEHPEDGLIVGSPQRDLKDTEGFGPDGGNSLIVNTRYLLEQPVLSQAGDRIGAADLRPEALSLLIPQGTDGSIEAMVKEYQEWIFFQASLPGGATDPEDIPIDYHVIPSGQSLFNYATVEATSRQLSPVVVVLPTTNTVYSDDRFTSAMTHGGVLFSNTEQLTSSLHEGGLSSSVVPNRVSDLAALRLADQERTLRASTLAGLLAGVIAVLSATLLAVSIAERNRRRDFLRHIHGTSPLRVALPPVAVLVVSNAGILGLASSAGLFEGPLALGAAGAVTAMDVVVIGALLALQRHRFRADTIKHS